MKYSKALSVILIIILFICNLSYYTSASSNTAPPDLRVYVPAPKDNSRQAIEEAYKEYKENYEKALKEYQADLYAMPTPIPAMQVAPNGNVAPVTGTEQHQNLFSDVTGHWALNSIIYCFDQGLINIYSDYTVRPDNAITRAEFAYSLDRWITKNQSLLKQLEFTYDSKSVTFQDVTPDNIYGQYIKSVASKGLMSSNASFSRPDDNLTRQEVCNVWVNLFKMLNNCTIDVAYFNRINPDYILNMYADKGSIETWARQSVAVMTDQRFIYGYPDQSFKPDSIITRAEAYSILANIELSLKNSTKTVKIMPTPLKAEDIKLIRFYAKNLSNNNGFDVEITVNDVATNMNTEVFIAFTTVSGLDVTKANIGTTSFYLNTRLIRLSDMKKVDTFAYQSVYSTYIGASFPQTYYVYAMLRTYDSTSDVLNCVVSVDKVVNQDTVYIDRPVYYPTTPIPVIPTPIPTPLPTITPIPTPEPTISPTPTVEPNTIPTLTPEPTATSTPTATPTPSPMPSPLPTPTVEPTPSPSPTPTVEPTPSPSPTPTPTPPSVLAVSTSLTGVHALVLDENGELWAWGWNAMGQLGNGTNSNSTIPIKIMDGVKQIYASSESSFAIKENGELWSWGSTSYGVLGERNGIDHSIPAKIMDNVKSISCHGEHVLAIKENSELWAWGRNTEGQLGIHNAGGKTPVKVMDNVKIASAGTYHSVAIKDNGELWAWGDNSHGQLGDGTNVNRSSPVKIMDDVIFAAGDSYTLAIKSNRTLWAWGNNMFGTLGDGSKVSTNKPKHIMDNMKYVSASIYYASAIKESGDLLCWGWNGYGQIGNGKSDGFNTGLGGGWGESDIIITKPTKVLENTKDAHAGYDFSLALTNDGKLWSWGDNSIGQLGNSTTVNSYLPRLIPFPPIP